MYPSALNTLGDHLKKRRFDLAITWKAVAAQLRTDVTTVANWVSGRSHPVLRHWPRILRWLEYDPRPEAGTIAQALKRYRVGQGVSQKQFAKQLGVDPATLSRWERNHRLPNGEPFQRVKAAIQT